MFSAMLAVCAFGTAALATASAGGTGNGVQSPIFGDIPGFQQIHFDIGSGESRDDPPPSGKSKGSKGATTTPLPKKTGPETVASPIPLPTSLGTATTSNRSRDIPPVPPPPGSGSNEPIPPPPPPPGPNPVLRAQTITLKSALFKAVAKRLASKSSCTVSYQGEGYTITQTGISGKFEDDPSLRNRRAEGILSVAFNAAQCNGSGS